MVKESSFKKMNLNNVWPINLQSFLREVENGEKGKEDIRESWLQI